MHDLFGVGSVGDKDTKNALGRFVSRGRWRKGSWVLVGAALTVGSLSERVQVRGRQSVARAPTRSPWTLLRSHCSPCPCWRTQRSRTLPTAPRHPVAALQPREERTGTLRHLLSRFFTSQAPFASRLSVRCSSAFATGSAYTRAACETKPLTPTARLADLLFLMKIRTWLTANAFSPPL